MIEYKILMEYKIQMCIYKIMDLLEFKLIHVYA